MVQVFCTTCGSGISDEDDFCRTCGRHQPGSHSTYYPMAPAKLAMLYVGTLGLYSFVWFWLQWRAMARQRGERMSPILRAAFFPVTSHNLFEAVAEDQADAMSRAAIPGERPLRPRVLAVSLMLFVWAVPLLVPWPWMLVWLLGFLPLLNVQSAINRLNPGGYHYSRNSRYPASLVLPLTPGTVLMIYLAAGLTGLVPPADVLAGRMLSARQAALVRGLAGLEAGERIEAYYSADRLSYAADGNVVTDRRVVSYFRDADGVMALDSVEYGRIRSLHVVFGDFFTPTSIIVCIGRGASMTLYSSGAFDGDARMIAAIRTRLRPGTPVIPEVDANFVCAGDISA